MSEYALLHIEKDSLRIEFCHIPFDVDEFEKVCLASSRPYAENEPKRYRLRGEKCTNRTGTRSAYRHLTQAVTSKSLQLSDKTRSGSP